MRNLRKKHKNPNARKALDEMKLEIAKELSPDSQVTGKVAGTMSRKLVEIGEKQLIDEDYDSINPS